MNYKVIELTKENEEQYLDQLANLEELVLETMEKEGRIGQLFITGKEDISEYIHSEENSVFIAKDKDKNIISATYITQGQVPFTYNDITKYFKYGEDYQQSIKSQYSEKDYKRKVLEAYGVKMNAFKYAKEQLLDEYSKYVENNELNFEKLMNKEINENDFHEKSALREKINKYMYEYISQQTNEEQKDLYEKFYWLSGHQVVDICAKDYNVNILKNKDIRDYEKFLESSKLEIFEDIKNGKNEYYNANTSNSIEIDTYITSPKTRQMGLARIIVYEGIKKHIEKHFSNENNKEIYLCSTLHRNNLSSKYVSEFFGLVDNMYVKRRRDRTREVHITKVERENVQEYLNNIEDKLAVLYGYNPNNKEISEEKELAILKEQRQYELDEIKRIYKMSISSDVHNGHMGMIGNNMYKAKKVKILNERIQNLKKSKAKMEVADEER